MAHSLSLLDSLPLFHYFLHSIFFLIKLLINYYHLPLTILLNHFIHSHLFLIILHYLLYFLNRNHLVHILNHSYIKY